ncbi:MAG: heavy-metal-associated domain-containing protein [Bdellovibrionales bacterium]|nr:heavy-metal-associated domain-containing protein [Bdellovibrionales bacterium]
MKFIIIFLTGVLVSSTSLASEKEVGANVKDKEVIVNVKGMVCAFCAQGITKKFKAEPTVSNIDVSLEKKIVKLSIKEGKELPDAKIESLLKDSGYTVEKIKRNGT